MSLVGDRAWQGKLLPELVRALIAPGVRAGQVTFGGWAPQSCGNLALPGHDG